MLLYTDVLDSEGFQLPVLCVLVFSLYIPTYQLAEASALLMGLVCTGFTDRHEKTVEKRADQEGPGLV